MKEYLNKTIVWSTEYSDGTKVNDLFIGVHLNERFNIIYDNEKDRWVNFEYAKLNLIEQGKYYIYDRYNEHILRDEETNAIASFPSREVAVANAYNNEYVLSYDELIKEIS